MSIATQIQALQSDKTAISNAITAKGGTVSSGDGFDDFASDIATIPQGGSTGYKVYYYHNTGGSGDNAYMRINGGDAAKVTVQMPDASFYGAYSLLGVGIETIKFWGFDHSGTFPSGASSWVRWRLHSGGAWNNYSCSRTEQGAATITLTGDIDLEVYEGTCLNKGTLITMADGTKKPVEEIEVGDLIMNYDGKPDKVRRSQKGSRQFLDFRDIWTFENAYQIITTGRHEFYNIERQKVTYLDEWNVGEHAYSEKGEKVALISHIHEDTPCMHFSLWTENENYFAGGLLSGNRYTGDIIINV